MDESELEKISSKTKPSDGQGNQEDSNKSDDHCTHWGLKRWIYGIKEYVIDRCLCCTMCYFDPMDKDRAFNVPGGSTSDCWCVVWSKSDTSVCLSNNLITGTLCLPLAITMHLLCLPCACCSPTNRDEWYGDHSPERKMYIEKEYKRICDDMEQRKAMRLDRGIDNETHLKNCHGGSEVGPSYMFATLNICKHPAHYGGKYSKTKTKVSIVDKD
jgi:hypothetical protein